MWRSGCLLNLLLVSYIKVERRILFALAFTFGMRLYRESKQYVDGGVAVMWRCRCDDLGLT